MKKKWEVFSTDKQIIEDVSKKFNVSNLVATILINRGITSDEDIKVFLNPTRNDFRDPFKMPDMKKAVDRILKAIKNNEKTIIYGDYDVDGITSTTVLSKFLKEQGLETGYYIPNRLDEGYGLNKEAIKKIADDGYSLIITVDCGISSIEEIDYANNLGLEVIVTDHHEPLEELPKAVAVVDLKRKDNKYGFNGLAGVGVAFKVCQALSNELKLPEESYLKYLDIVCIGTISDIVPLIDEDRVIAKLGLMLVEKTKSPGLKALIKAISYKEINSSAISFGIAPRINACGRMGFENDALKLFLTDNLVEANDITLLLNKYNRDRQDIEKKIYEEALSKIEKEKLYENDVIVVGKEGWHHGVIGIVSSKITEKYFKPSILLCFEDGMAKGSGRSIPGFDLHQGLCKCSDLLDKYGGHEMAVGLSLKKSNLEKFIKAINEYAKSLNTSEIVPVIKVDKEITIKDLNIDNVKSLNILEPFGEANKTPVFIYKNLRIDSIRALSEGKHLKLTLKEGGHIINAIGFNLGHLTNEYLIGDKVDVLGTIEINSFNGNELIQINLNDIRKSY